MVILSTADGDYLIWRWFSFSTVQLLIKMKEKSVCCIYFSLQNTGVKGSMNCVMCLWWRVCLWRCLAPNPSYRLHGET